MSHSKCTNLQESCIIFSRQSEISLLSNIYISLGRRDLIYSIVNYSLLFISFALPNFLLLSIIALIILLARGFTLPSTIVDISLFLRSCKNCLWFRRKSYYSFVTGSDNRSSSFSGSYFKILFCNTSMFI